MINEICRWRRSTPWRSKDGRYSRKALSAICAFGAMLLLAACQPTKTVTRVVEVEKPPQVVERVVEVEKPRCELRSFDGGRSFLVEAWGLPGSDFDVGEPLRLQMRASAAAHVSVYYVSSSCKVTRLLNNRPVKATEIVDFPTPESGLVMTVKPPAGEEAFYFVATRQPLDFPVRRDRRRHSGPGGRDRQPRHEPRAVLPASGGHAGAHQPR